jgi:predicted Zn-dependent protease
VLLTVSIAVVAVVFAVTSWWALAVAKVDVKNWAGASVLALWVAGVGIKALVDLTGEDDAARTLEARATRPLAAARSLAWPVDLSATRAGAGRGAAASAAPVASSVESLIAPLEARLAGQPEDVKGWALLAQSYAYVGDDAGAERAFARAVELGMDEATLRARLDAARRSQAHAGLGPLAAGG